MTRAQAEEAFGILFEGEATPSQIGGLLMALRTRGETVDEYAAAAAVMRAKCNPVVAPEGAMDIVGTGGDGKGTLNISTATAFVVAGAACDRGETWQPQPQLQIRRSRCADTDGPEHDGRRTRG